MNVTRISSAVLLIFALALSACSTEGGDSSGGGMQSGGSSSAGGY